MNLIRSTAASALVAGTLFFNVNAAADIEAPSGTYVVESTHAYITISYSHLGFSTPHVGFNDFDVTLEFDAAAPENSTLNVVVDATSVDSRVADFDDHLNGEDFFQTDMYPEITFASTKIEMTGPDTALITGDLTIKDQTHPVTLEATLNKAGMHPMLKTTVMGFNASATLNRSQWGLGYAVPMVGDEVDLEITVEMMPKG
ncbi:MAG: YceI family protein [Pseudomonadota bacterium]